MTDDPADRFRALATTLSAMPDMWRRLLAEHAPDDAGRCRGCRVPGYGSPGEPWPCTIHALAREARQLAERDRPT